MQELIPHETWQSLGETARCALGATLITIVAYKFTKALKEGVQIYRIIKEERDIDDIMSRYDGDDSAR